MSGVGAAAELRETGSHHQAVEAAGAVHKVTRVDTAGQEPSEHQIVANWKVAEVLAMSGRARQSGAWRSGLRGYPLDPWTSRPGPLARRGPIRHASQAYRVEQIGVS